MLRGCAGALVVVAAVVLGACDRDEPAPRAAAARLAPPPAAPPASPPKPLVYEPREAWDRCHREGHPEPAVDVSDEGSVGKTDLAHDLPILCALRPDRALRLTAVLDTFGFPAAILVHDPPAAAEARDTLRLDPGDLEIPYAGATWIEGEDLNGDGWTDVKVMTYYGSGGRMFDVFRYDPARQRFEKDTVFSGGGNVHRVGETACSTRSWMTGAGNDSYTELCWRDGRWVNSRAGRHTFELRRGPPEVSISVHEESVWRNGRWHVTRSDTTRREAMPSSATSASPRDAPAVARRVPQP